MNNYKDFEVKDWLEDLKFRNWVYRGEADRFWESVMENNPSQHENIEQARSILLSVRGEIDFISEDEVKSIVSGMLESISHEDKSDKNPWWKGKWLQVAAMVLMTIGLGQYYRTRILQQPEPYFSMLQGVKSHNMMEVINDSPKIKLVNLPDGSSVILKEKARISFPKEFAREKREVYLLGEAFFEVEKNQDQPFFVYAGDLVTRVTGTSFSIQANQKDDVVNLVVKTGVVEVSSSEKESANEKLILNPNQLVTLTKKSREMKMRAVENSVLLDLAIESQDFSFKRTPLKQVFEMLENTYGVHIGFDQTVTALCTITAKLGDEPVIEKLDMICAVINAKYDIKNGIIKIVSDGCNE